MTATSQSAPTQPNPDKRDFRKEVTDSIVRMLEQGVAPWQKPWDATGPQTPFNPTSGKAYRGGNALHLVAIGLQRGYTDPRWMTYRQASENGWQVRKGERGSHIEFWDYGAGKARDSSSRVDGNEAGLERDTKRRKPIHRVYTVFNAQQIDGMPKHEIKERTPFEVARAGEQILLNSGAKLYYDQRDRAFYDRRRDSIHLPPKEAFKDAGSFYGTALHELSHWTGTPGRLNRSTLNESYKFGDVNYAREELRAEIASLFIAAGKGIPHDPTSHAAYVDSWIKALTDNKHEIFWAAQDASKAADYVLSLDHEKEMATGAGRQVNSTEHAAHVPGQTARKEIGRAILSVNDQKSGTGLRQAESPSAEKFPVPGQRDTRPSADELANSFSGAKQVVTAIMGTETKTLVATTDSGAYRGKVIGHTEHHTIQQISPRTAVAHMSHLLDSTPAANDTVVIGYSNSRAAVKQCEERNKAHGVAR